MTVLLFFAVLFFAGFVTGYYFAYKKYKKYLVKQQEKILDLYEKCVAYELSDELAAMEGRR